MDLSKLSLVNGALIASFFGMAERSCRVPEKWRHRTAVTRYHPRVPASPTWYWAVMSAT